MIENDFKNLKVKLLKKTFDKYSDVAQQQLQDEYALLIQRIQKPHKVEESYTPYLKVIKKLNVQRKTVLFYGVPVRLSKMQFLFLYIVLVNKYFDSSLYKEISEKSNQKNLSTNFKTFISRFHSKFRDSINKYKKNHDCYFSNMSAMEINCVITSLLSYKLYSYDSNANPIYQATTKYYLEE